MRHTLVMPLRIFFFVIVALGLLNVWSYAQTTKGAYTTTADVPLRSGPGNFHEVITTLPKGIKINVVGKEGFWLKVESKHGGKPGYIDEQFAKPLTDATGRANQCEHQSDRRPVPHAEGTRPARRAENKISSRRESPSRHQSQRHPRRRRLVESRIETRRQAGLRRQTRRRALARSLMK